MNANAIHRTEKKYYVIQESLLDFLKITILERQYAPNALINNQY